MDAGEFDRLGELFTGDFVYDVEALGFGSLEGDLVFAEASRALGDDNPLGHHVTNALVIADEDDEATVRSKGIGILADGTCSTIVYRSTHADLGRPSSHSAPGSLDLARSFRGTG
jgi:SnoaL-like domain